MPKPPPGDPLVKRVPRPPDARPLAPPPGRLSPATAARVLAFRSATLTGPPRDTVRRWHLALAAVVWAAAGLLLAVA